MLIENKLKTWPKKKAFLNILLLILQGRLPLINIFFFTGIKTL